MASIADTSGVSAMAPNEEEIQSSNNDKPIKASPSIPQDSKTQPRCSDLPVVNNVFYNEETLKYMKIIDMYKRLGIGKDIELPRLVIAGAQSCGKSSLLENLTGLPVPITTGIGTRFPIEITLLEDSKKSQTKPSIILDPKARNLSTMDKDKIQKFNISQIYHDPMTQIEFENLLRQVSDLLGVPPPVFAGEQASGLKTVEASSQISSHILQIEMRGKDFKSLSFVDTPGLYHSGNTEQDVTSVEDIETLVTSLIAEKRTLIVAVMEAGQSTVGQKIFKFADDVDTSGERTIGVMTKCDLAVTSDTDAFAATLRRAKNQDRTLKHGWYVVKNRSSTEAKTNVSLDAARGLESKLFGEISWSPNSSGIQSDRMGITSLRTGLSNVFCAHIRAEFPAFNKQTREILNQKRTQLAALGPARSRPDEQRNYLKSIVDAYQYPKTRCLTEDYRAISNSKKDAALALERTLAKKKKVGLRDTLKYRGAVWTFQTPTGERDIYSDTAASALFIKGITENIYTWINHRYQETKSCAMPGLVPYGLIERLFEEQTARWSTITAQFVDSVTEVFISAAVNCLRVACTNNVVCAALERLMRAEITKKLEDFRISCNSLIRSERKGMQVIACEEQFVNDIRESRTLRFISAMAQLEHDSLLEKTPPFPPPFTSSTSPISLFGNPKLNAGLSIGASASTTRPTNRGGPSKTSAFGSAFGSGFGGSFGGGFGGASSPATTASTSATLNTGGPFGGASKPATTASTFATQNTGGLFGRASSLAITSASTSASTSTTSDSPPVTPKTANPVASLSVPKPEATQTTFKTLRDFAMTNRFKLREVLTDDRQLVYEIHDILKAYYTISVQSYTDMVCKNRLDDDFTNDIMNLFSMELIGMLTDSEITEIAAESPADRKRRRELKEDIEKLEMAISESEAILAIPLPSE